MSTASSGRAREWKVRDHLITNGWHLVARSAGSKGAADLVMVHPFHGLALIQVGTSSKSIGPDDRARFLDLAGMCGAVAVLATVIPRDGIHYTQVGLNPASRWERWTP